MKIEFIGAAQTVTGSRHLLHLDDGTNVLLDCGLYQGRRREANQLNKDLGLDATSLDAVVLSHAHIDHSGALPVLTKRGYERNVYATPATRDLIAVMLEDAASIQASDARYINHRIDRDGSDMERVEPLYTSQDVLKLLSQTISVPYHRRVPITGGVNLEFLDAGHVLGSAISVLDIKESAGITRLAFSGDLGRSAMPILRDPQTPTGVEVLLLESTYGAKNHAPIERMHNDLAEVLNRTFARGGRVIIPSFALERAQEVLYVLRELCMSKAIPTVPVYVDSPLTTHISDIFRMHPECYDEELHKLLHSGSPFDFAGLHYTADVEASKELSRSRKPCVIIAASGMCEAGRVLHHLRASIENEQDTVVIVGFQAQHTLGRRLVEGRSRVRIFGVERDVRAEIVVLDGFSAHAGRDDLLRFAEDVRSKGNLRNVVLVHGEPESQVALADELLRRGFTGVVRPKPGEVLDVATGKLAARATG